MTGLPPTGGMFRQESTRGHSNPSRSRLSMDGTGGSATSKREEGNMPCWRADDIGNALLAMWTLLRQPRFRGTPVGLGKSGGRGDLPGEKPRLSPCKYRVIYTGETPYRKTASGMPVFIIWCCQPAHQGQGRLPGKDIQNKCFLKKEVFLRFIQCTHF